MFGERLRKTAKQIKTVAIQRSISRNQSLLGYIRVTMKLYVQRGPSLGGLEGIVLDWKILTDFSRSRVSCVVSG